MIESRLTPTSLDSPPMPRDALFEFHRIGAFVKVTAIDTETGIEVSIVGPSNGGDAMLRANALRKLEAALRRRDAESS